MPRLHSSLGGYALTSGLAVASLALAMAVDRRMDAPAPQRPPAAAPQQVAVGARAIPVGDGNAEARGWRETGAPPPQLAGVLVSEGAQRVAMVTVNGLSNLLVRPGDMLDGGYKVLAIDGNSLTYRDADGRARRVAVPDAPIPGEAAPAKPVAAPAAAPAPIAESAAPASGNEAFRRAVEQHMASMRQ